MTKTTETDEPLDPRPGGTRRALEQLQAATHRLALRRARDSLPGKIVTRRLVLRAPMRGDVPEMVRLADNRAIAERLTRMPHPYSRADAVGFIEIVAQRDDERPYAITLDDSFIGIIGLSFHDGSPPELGYWLGEPFWGRGLMSEAARGLVDAAHRTPHFPLIAARALADNAGSLGVLEKIGFARTGRTSLGTAPMSEGATMLHLELERPRWM